jgi:hypothetical protein
MTMSDDLIDRLHNPAFQSVARAALGEKKE